MAFRTIPLADLKRQVTALYNKGVTEGLTDHENLTIEAMERELNRRGLVLVERVLIKENPKKKAGWRGRSRKVRRISR